MAIYLKICFFFIFFLSVVLELEIRLCLLPVKTLVIGKVLNNTTIRDPNFIPLPSYIINNCGYKVNLFTKYLLMLAIKALMDQDDY